MPYEPRWARGAGLILAPFLVGLKGKHKDSPGDLAMGQKPVPPVNIPIPTKIGSKMGGATPKNRF